MVTTLPLYNGASQVAQYPTPLPKYSSSPFIGLVYSIPVAKITDFASKVLSFAIKAKYFPIA